MAFSFIKKGAESEKLAKQEEAASEARKEEMGKMWRFFLKKGETAAITFVDGALNEKGLFVPTRFYEHDWPIQNRPHYFVCPEQTNPEGGDKCPICATGKYPYLAAVFTIIDHRQFTSTKQGSEGKVFKDRPRLLVAKPKTVEMLTLEAQKRGGLEGCLFDVYRSTDQTAAAVGSTFSFTSKTPVAQLKGKWFEETKDPKTNVVTKVDCFQVANYEEEITYRTGDELRKLGYWTNGPVANLNPGGNVPPQTPSTEAEEDYEKHL